MSGDDLLIPEQTIDVWLFNLQALIYDEELFLSFLDQEEQARADRFRLPELRQRYIHTHGILRCILAEYLPSLSPEKITILHAEFGKPYLPDYPLLSFNLSHSGSWVLIGVTREAAIGVDIEIISDRAGLQGMIQKCFAADERVYWQQLPMEQKNPVFFDFWTCKESLVKAVGRGIALGMEKCVVDTVSFPCFVSLPSVCGSAAAWQLFTLQVDGNCKAALVVNARTYNMRQREIASIAIGNNCG